jgi:uncharacterized membrane protein YdjX (TVP38/TMEM64 family)
MGVTLKSLVEKFKIPIGIIVGLLVVLLVVYRHPLWGWSLEIYNLLTDRDQIKAFVLSFGAFAPVVFIFIQILQVLFAPFPGEATGFVGGFLFGTQNGFIYSSIGLTLGSLINFSIGRFLGKRYVRKMIPYRQLNKLDALVKRQGAIVFFVLFVFPGFPKDYLSLFLGMTAIPTKLFIAIAAIGRMPGTLMLSLQGSMVFEKQYGWFVAILGFCLALVFLAYRYRENLYRWLEKQ